MIGFGYGLWKRVIWRSGGTSEASSAASTAGQPIGLLLALTKAS
jgi:hypothetical protein